MTIQELMTKIKKSKTKDATAAQMQALLKKHIKVKNYISIKDKKELVDKIVNECVFVEDGIKKIDSIEKYIVFTMRTIEEYTNLELSDDIENDYDALCEARILGDIVDLFKPEYDDIMVLLKMRCDFIIGDNNIEAQVGRLLNGVLDIISRLADTVERKVNDVDLDSIPFNDADFQVLKNFLNQNKLE